MVHLLLFMTKKTVKPIIVKILYMHYTDVQECHETVHYIKMWSQHGAITVQVNVI